MKSKLLYTLFSIFVILASVGVVSAGIVKCSANWIGIHKTAATDEGYKFAKELSLDVDAIFCVNQDTDGDGYVSCTFKLSDGTTAQYECAGAMNLNSGCREPKINVRDGGRPR